MLPPHLSTFFVTPRNSSASSSPLLRFSSSSWIRHNVGHLRYDATRISSCQRLGGCSLSSSSSSLSSFPSHSRAASTSSDKSGRRRPPTPAAAASDRGYDADAESDSLAEDEHRKIRRGATTVAAKRKGKAAEAAAEDETPFSSSSSSSWPGSDVEDEDDARRNSGGEGEGGGGEGDPSAALRAALFREALGKVPELGWSQEALAAAALSLGLSPSAARLARRGPADLALWYIKRCNDEFAESLGEGFVAAAAAAGGGGKSGAGAAEEKTSNSDNSSSSSSSARLEELASLPGTTARIEAAIWWRLQAVARFSSTWHQAVAAVALAGPRAAAEAARELWRWSDDAWTLAAGDRGLDAAATASPNSYYSKRATLAAVYAACELHLLADYSPGHDETRRSVRRRLEDAAEVAKFSKSVLGGVAAAPLSPPGSFAHFAAGAASRAREAACWPARGRGGRVGAEWEGGGGGERRV